jgi:hypothetical protein
MTRLTDLKGIELLKAREGAAATLTALQIVGTGPDGTAPYHYRLLAVGDSNFFHWRQRDGAWTLLLAFPFTTHADFGTLPDSINSRSFNRDNITALLFDSRYPERYTQSRDVGSISLAIEANDVLMLATDAVAQWILTLDENKQREEINGLLQMKQKDEQHWPAIINTARGIKDSAGVPAIVNDDSTLLLIRVPVGEDSLRLPAPDSGERVQKRTEELRSALRAWADGQDHGRDIDLALAFGDGHQLDPALAAWLADSIAVGDQTASHVTLWRANADAYKWVSDTIRRALRTQDTARTELRRVWESIGPQLSALPWAASLGNTVRDMLNVPAPAPPAAAPVAPPPSPSRLPAALRAWIDDEGRSMKPRTALLAALADETAEPLRAVLRNPVRLDPHSEQPATSHEALWAAQRDQEQHAQEARHTQTLTDLQQSQTALQQGQTRLNAEMQQQATELAAVQKQIGTIQQTTSAALSSFQQAQSDAVQQLHELREQLTAVQGKFAEAKQRWTRLLALVAASSLILGAVGGGVTTWALESVNPPPTPAPIATAAPTPPSSTEATPIPGSTSGAGDLTTPNR